MERFQRWVAVPVGYLGALALLLLSLTILGSIIGRQMGRTVTGSAEAAEILLVMLVFLALTYTQSRDGHVSIEAVVFMMPRRARLICRALSLAICLALALTLFYGTAVEAYESYRLGEYKFGTTRFPLWPDKNVIALGFLLLSIQIGLQLLDALRRVFAPPPVKE